MWPNWNSTNYYIFYRRSQWTIFPVVLSDEYANEPPAQTLFFFKKMIIIIIIFILILVANPDWNRNQWTSRRSATGGQFCLFFPFNFERNKKLLENFQFRLARGRLEQFVSKDEISACLSRPPNAFVESLEEIKILLSHRGEFNLLKWILWEKQTEFTAPIYWLIISAVKSDFDLPFG